MNFGSSNHLQKEICMKTYIEYCIYTTIQITISREITNPTVSCNSILGIFLGILHNDLLLSLPLLIPLFNSKRDFSGGETYSKIKI